MFLFVNFYYAAVFLMHFNKAAKHANKNDNNNNNYKEEHSVKKIQNKF